MSNEDTDPERISRIEKIKQHLKDNKKTYAVGVGCLAAGYFLRRPIAAKAVRPVINNTVAPMIAPVFNNTVNNGGHMRKIVRCLETDELWPSVTVAAEAVNTSLHYMSRHLNGAKPDVHGLHYVIEALATS